MRKLAIAAMVSGALFIQAPGASADATRVAQAPGGTSEKSGAAAEKMPGKGAAVAVKIRGTIDAIDKDKGTVTLKGPKGRTVTLEVRDRQKLDAVKVGDPVVATYMEAVVIQARKAGTATPGVTTQETRVSSKPGETPAGAIGREVTVTATLTAIDRKAQTVTIKGPRAARKRSKPRTRRTSRR
jgi:hypothetical protein